MGTYGNAVVYTTETPWIPRKPGYWDSYSELEATPTERAASML